MLTKSGHSIVEKDVEKTASIYSAIAKDAVHPLSAGFGTLGVMSGDQSVGGAVGGTLGSSAGYVLGSKGAGALTKFLPKKYKWLGKGLNFLGGAAGGIMGWTPGAKAGEKTPIWKREDADPFKQDKNEVKDTSDYINNAGFSGMNAVSPSIRSVQNIHR